MHIDQPGAYVRVAAVNLCEFSRVLMASVMNAYDDAICNHQLALCFDTSSFYIDDRDGFNHIASVFARHTAAIEQLIWLFMAGVKGRRVNRNNG